MNNLRNSLLLLSIAFLFLQCGEPMEYKYADKPFGVSCPGADEELMREALYSFQEDISNFYRDPDIRQGTKSAYIDGYKKFIYRGMEGTAPYGEIASPHTLEVLERLKKIDGLWDRDRKDSNLNYSGEFMTCLFSNIKDPQLNTHFQSLLKVDHISPKLLAETMRTQMPNIFSDEYLALYVALDGYYQYLLDIPTKNE